MGLVDMNIYTCEVTFPSQIHASSPACLLSLSPHFHTNASHYTHMHPSVPSQNIHLSHTHVYCSHRNYVYMYLPYVVCISPTHYP